MKKEDLIEGKNYVYTPGADDYLFRWDSDCIGNPHKYVVREEVINMRWNFDAPDRLRETTPEEDELINKLLPLHSEITENFEIW